MVQMDNWSEFSTGNTLRIILYASWGWTEEDIEWKTLLQERFAAHDDGHRAAKNFCMDLRHLREYPRLDDKGREALQRMS
ncbi:hypothetical protein GB937_000072 [Aspergillus fischeri]|nr:hypothetical protein GB937_000072 [Aspergillus fischeri]